MDNNIVYQQTLHDLQERRDKCIGELDRLDSAIEALSATMTADAPLPPPPPNIAKPSEWKRRFADMSIRWAVLKLFAEHSRIGPPAEQSMTSSEVSAALIDGGNDKASRPNVSAVISDMVNQRDELIPIENGSYSLTENGRAAWSAIAHSSRYINRGSKANKP